MLRTSVFSSPLSSASSENSRSRSLPSRFRGQGRATLRCRLAPHCARNEKRKQEVGASTVEAAMVLPLLLLAFIGIIEFSLLMTSRANMKAAVTAAVRVGSVASKSADSDFVILKEIGRSLSSKIEQVDYVIVFNANAAVNSQPSTQCIQSAKTGGAGVGTQCNIYYRAALANPIESTFGYDALTNATATSDKFWPAKTRSATYSGGRDLLGVYIASTSKSITGLVPKVAMKTVSILRIEAQDV